MLRTIALFPVTAGLFVANADNAASVPLELPWAHPLHLGARRSVSTRSIAPRRWNPFHSGEF